MQLLRTFLCFRLSNITLKRSVHSRVALQYLKNDQIVDKSNNDGKVVKIVSPQCTNIKIRVPEGFKLPSKKHSLSDFDLPSCAEQYPVLQSLVDLGVEIHKWNNNSSLCNYILTLNFKNDIFPYLLFLTENGVPKDALAKFITKNPYIFKSSIDDLKTRLQYLNSKKFTTDMIAVIITRNPYLLSLEVKDLDKRLGFIQTVFRLTGEEVRFVLTTCPAVGTITKENIMLTSFFLKEEMGLNYVETREVLLKLPSLLKRDSNQLVKTYFYLAQKMNIPVELIIKQPEILTTRVHILSSRHNFLQKLGRAQYNPKMPGYVFLLDLVRTTDSEFCKKIAMTSLETYEMYLKSM